MNSYNPTIEQAKADAEATNALAENSACILVHNLPGTPHVAFSCYGQGAAYDLAVEIIKSFHERELSSATRAGAGAEVSGQGPEPDGHAEASIPQ